MTRRARLLAFLARWTARDGGYEIRVGSARLSAEVLSDDALEDLAARVVADFWSHRRRVLGVSAGFITVPVWKRSVGIGAGRGQKSTARAEATRRWPRHAETFARARDDGRAESALIGLAGIMRERAGR